ncbi:MULTISPECIES: MAB_1171c family putative transporter [unclassified Streptomyces]|uniref:MAB_1171c family putative transporter n=1 Tax=unclassified Streptomyces TaxID=2593676 RepID=UPI001F046364|nr:MULTISPECIES: MAB_1171c family putative transporter [unclassified Streptomyces]MCH0565217.1 hypothetical protein [Streptomyces sp. MUM 2J]MCH0568300.1 hypothetical protein [Streptomyces sp. MUM 136J]
MSAPAQLALDPAGLLSRFSVSFWLPIAALTVALAIKLPSLVKMWRDPLLRGVGGLLLFACAVFVFAYPSTISWTNRVTGVPNISAPWVYSLLTALCASWLLLIVAWRNGTDRSRSTRRAARWVVVVYTGVVVALWVLFALADVPVERTRDLDTYYARTPFMREEILLYLLAHTAACSVTARLIWNWVRTDGLDAWLRWGLRLLGIGYGTNLLFDAAKLTAVAARWTGTGRLDWLSTELAPSAACVSATLVAVGFILPHGGQYLQERWRIRADHWRLRPLYRLMRTVSGGRAPFAPRSTAELRLIRRETFIRDALLPLSRYLDEGLRARAHEAAVALGFAPGRAKALAAAVTMLDAVAARERTPRTDSTAPPSGPDTAYLLQEIQAVSRVLRRHDDIEAVRARAAALAESVPAHE